jgi:hypothetical protein
MLAELNHVIEYIEDHLTDDISLEAIIMLHLVI